MRLIAWRMLGNFAGAHPDAYAVLRIWEGLVESAAWNSFADLRRDFPSVDAIGDDRYIFNIGGNKYRLICAISFPGKVVLTKWIGTHAEYDRIDPRRV